MHWASLVAQRVKNLLAVQETQVQPLGREDSLEESLAIYSRVLAWTHGQRSLAGYSLWGHKESDTTECSSQAPLSMGSSRQEY